MQVHDGDRIILVGHRNKLNGLWHVDLASPAMPTVRLANSIGNPTTAELVTFAHASMFSPVLSTLEAALSIGWLTNFPGLTLAALKTHHDQDLWQNAIKTRVARISALLSLYPPSLPRTIQSPTISPLPATTAALMLSLQP
jgi:hypothetical protein